MTENGWEKHEIDVSNRLGSLESITKETRDIVQDIRTRVSVNEMKSKMITAFIAVVISTVIGVLMKQ